MNSGIRGQPPVRSHDKHDESMTLKGVEEYHFIQREGSITIDRFMLMETFI